MKVGTKFATLALAAGAALAPQAGAQQLGWNSSLSASCVNIACTSVTFVQSLLGLQPSATLGPALTPALIALGNPGYMSAIQITGGPTVNFLSATVLTGTGWTVVPVLNNLLMFDNIPFTAAPVSIFATLATSGAGQFFTSGGTAHLTPGGTQFFDYNGNPTSAGAFNASTCTPTDGSGCVYESGTFATSGNGTLLTSTPEPGSLALLATGLVGMVGVVSRRRRNAKA